MCINYSQPSKSVSVDLICKSPILIFFFFFCTCHCQNFSCYLCFTSTGKNYWLKERMFSDSFFFSTQDLRLIKMYAKLFFHLHFCSHLSHEINIKKDLMGQNDLMRVLVLPSPLQLKTFIESNEYVKLISNYTLVLKLQIVVKRGLVEPKLLQKQPKLTFTKDLHASPAPPRYKSKAKKLLKQAEAALQAPLHFAPSK